MFTYRQRERERERERERQTERERRSRGGTYSDEVTGVSNGSLAVSPSFLVARPPCVYRLVLVISEDTSYEERCTALTHNGAATRECPLSRVAESHGDPRVSTYRSRVLRGLQCRRKWARALKARTMLIALHALARVLPLSLSLSLYMYSIWATGESCPTDEQLSVTPVRQTLAADRRASSTLLSLLVGM